LREALTLSQSGRIARFRVSVLRQRQASGRRVSPPSSAPGGFLFTTQQVQKRGGQKVSPKKISTSKAWWWVPKGIYKNEATPHVHFFLEQFRVNVNVDLTGGVVRKSGSPDATSPPPCPNAVTDFLAASKRGKR